MLLIYSKAGNNERYYKVYESITEFQESDDKNKLNKLDRCEEGDYIITDNGYVVPLIKKYVYDSNPKNKHYFVDFVFPRARHRVCCYNRKYFLRKPLLFFKENIPKPKKKNLTHQMRLFAIYLSRGIDIVDAFKLCYKVRYRNLHVEITRILSTDIFIDYLIKELKMLDKFKNSLNDKGVNYDMIAEFYKKELNNDKNTFDQRYQIAERIIEIHSIEDKDTDKEEDNSYQARLLKKHSKIDCNN